MRPWQVLKVTLLNCVFCAALVQACFAEETHSPPVIKRLSLVDAKTDQILFELKDGQIINFSELPTRELNVIAETEPERVSRVVFGLNNYKLYRSESGAPYLLAGNVGKDYNSWTPRIGKNVITVTAEYKGKKSVPQKISFQVVDKKVETPLKKAVQNTEQEELQPKEAIRPDAVAEEGSDPMASFSWEAHQEIMELIEQDPLEKEVVRQTLLGDLGNEMLLPKESPRLPPQNSSFEFKLTSNNQSIAGECFGAYGKEDSLLSVMCFQTIKAPFRAEILEGGLNAQQRTVCEFSKDVVPILSECTLSLEQYDSLAKGRMLVSIVNTQDPTQRLYGQIR